MEAGGAVSARRRAQRAAAAAEQDLKRGAPTSPVFPLAVRLSAHHAIGAEGCRVRWLLWALCSPGRPDSVLSVPAALGTPASLTHIIALGAGVPRVSRPILGAAVSLFLSHSNIRGGKSSTRFVFLFRVFVLFSPLTAVCTNRGRLLFYGAPFHPHLNRTAER